MAKPSPCPGWGRHLQADQKGEDGNEEGVTACSTSLVRRHHRLRCQIRDSPFDRVKARL